MKLYLVTLWAAWLLALVSIITIGAGAEGDLRTLALIGVFSGFSYILGLLVASRLVD